MLLRHFGFSMHGSSILRDVSDQSIVNSCALSFSLSPILHCEVILMQFHGTVARQSIAIGSKNEHEAVVLLTNEGPLKLRRPGGNPFHDPELEDLVGKEITCQGEIYSGQLVMQHWDLVSCN
jgi:hypothetical protein